MKDPLWRIEESKLYWIVTKEKDRHLRDVSRFAPFKPFPHQKRLNRAIYRDGYRRLLIPKARRMGFSTDINMCQYDACLNNENFHSRIVDMSEDDAKDKLVNRVGKAWEKLSSMVDTGLETVVNSSKEISWTNGSRFTASISGRGGDAAQFLHVSELGPIDFKDPKRADEVIDGAFPAADGGIIAVESTAKGPLGHFKRLCDTALEVPPEERTALDWYVLFFAWFEDPRHRAKGRFARVSKETNDYLDYVERERGITLDDEQRLWYHLTSETSANVKYEYPSLLEECWEAPIDGAIYAEDINKARSEGRVGTFPYSPSLPVFTIWDLGGPRNTRCIFFQLLHGEIRIIDAAMGATEGATRLDGPREPGDWAQLLREKGYNYGAHLLPHDGSITEYGGLTYKEQLERAGLTGIRLMPRRRPNDHWQYINPTWSDFKRFIFNKANPNVEVLLNHLSCYHTKTLSDGLTINKIPNHDWSSHFAEPFSMITTMIEQGYCGSTVGSGMPSRARRKPQMAKYNAYG